MNRKIFRTYVSNDCNIKILSTREYDDCKCVCKSTINGVETRITFCSKNQMDNFIKEHTDGNKCTKND